MPGIGGRLWPEPFDLEPSELAPNAALDMFKACGEFAAEEELRLRCVKPPMEEEEEIDCGFREARSTV